VLLSAIGSVYEMDHQERREFEKYPGITTVFPAV
jgi:hypothetical protein